MKSESIFDNTGYLNCFKEAISQYLASYLNLTITSMKELMAKMYSPDSGGI